MSNFSFTAKSKQTGKTLQVDALDDHFGRHRYGYKTGNRILTEEEFAIAYERVDEAPQDVQQGCCDGCRIFHPMGNQGNCWNPSCSCHTQQVESNLAELTDIYERDGLMAIEKHFISKLSEAREATLREVLGELPTDKEQIDKTDPDNYGACYAIAGRNQTLQEVRTIIQTKLRK